MFRNLHRVKEFLEHPVASTARHLGKARLKNRAYATVLKDALSGRYTARRIEVPWDPQTRMDLINQLISSMGYTRYLEIGCFRNVCFDLIRAPHKVGVDPVKGGTHRMTSDAFFAQNHETFDCIFIDGLHEYSQVVRDVDNALKVLADGGVILMHDCLPTSYLAQIDGASLADYWNGDTWKAAVELRTRPQIDMAVVQIDHGVGVIRKRANAKPLSLRPASFKNLTFGALAENFSSWLNVIRYHEALGFVKGNG